MNNTILQRGDIIEIDITDLAFGGDGVGRYDDFVCFVHYALPGERVKAQVYRKKKSFAYCRLIEILVRSEFRTEPQCRHFYFCGGCSLQHLIYEKQLEYKLSHVKDCFYKNAGMTDFPLNPVLASENKFYYRNKMEYTCSVKEWTPEPPDKTGIPHQSFNIGLLYPKFYNKVINLTECFLQSEESIRIVTLIRDFCRKNDIAAYDHYKHTGLLRFVGVRESKSTGQRMVSLYSGSLEDRDNDIEKIDRIAEMLLNSDVQVDVLTHIIAHKKGQVADGGVRKYYTGLQEIDESVGSVRFSVGAQTFFQVNSLQIHTLYDLIKKYARFTGKENIIDLYCGVGSISLYCAGSIQLSLGLELVPDSVEAARKNAERNSIGNCRYVAGDVVETLKSIDFTPDIIITDPPRSGMHPKAVKQLSRLGASQIIYVSCNPATLARDIDLLKEQYDLTAVQPVDMFPQTNHIECVANLIRNDKTGNR